jgi:hypothetical protein
MDNPQGSKVPRPGQINVCVKDPDGAPIQKALILVYRVPEHTGKASGKWQHPEGLPAFYDLTGSDGCVTFLNVEEADYVVECPNIPRGTSFERVSVMAGSVEDVLFTLDAKLEYHKTTISEGKESGSDHAIVNETSGLEITSDPKELIDSVGFPFPYTALPTARNKGFGIHTKAGLYGATATIYFKPPVVNALTQAGYKIPSAFVQKPIDTLVVQTGGPALSGQVGVTLQRSGSNPTRDQALWVAIRNRTKAIGFSGSGYKDFIDRVLCKQDLNPGSPLLNRQIQELGNQVYGVGAYELLKTATEVFLLLECGVAINQTGVEGSTLFDPDDESARLGHSVSLDEVTQRLTDYLGQGRLPYISRIIRTAFPGEGLGRIFCDGVLTSRVEDSCLIELIWNYWHEEGMLVQAMNAISRRFQNIRAPGARDPLAHLEIDPLRPLNNLLWGYIQDEQNLLTVRRRAYEYDHHYGLSLYGKAAPPIRPADSRSKFLEAFHNLLHLTSVFYKEDNDTTVIADGFPLLNALKEVHLLLAQGAHNQFGDLPWTARREMLIQQWLLARPEMRDFLQSRAMVPYKEAWMPQVDTMKTLQGWTDVTITHFRDLAVYGEQILLSVRYGDWIDVNNEDSAKNWARYWRPEVQAYLHAYRACTGVDLTNADTLDSTIPAAHLQKRLVAQQQRVR